jgi:threonine dehydrogenase-like Zn-dependent dehydrogenase
VEPGAAIAGRALAREPAGFSAAVDAAGDTRSWAMALASLRPGARACLFAGPPAGTRGDIDLHALHYQELAAVGAYHYRPADYAAALERLRSGAVDPQPLITAERPLAELEEGLRAMMRREALKVLIRP